ncbi:MAG: hypothetical protein Mars2KO_11150 [Maribacter sp.]|uniref:hypothetical protein n=1 Tax=Maribacter sp. 2307UL18-2 TaxID=3386274 RepID=UPI0039BC85DE
MVVPLFHGGLKGKDYLKIETWTVIVEMNKESCALLYEIVKQNLFDLLYQKK